jgi:FimV-like protein
MRHSIFRQHLQGGLSALFLTLPLAICPLRASALQLGKLEVLSSLGEPLRAEVAVPVLTPAESATLQLSISEPSLFQTPGVAYPSLEHGIQIELLRRPGGEPYLSLKSSQEIKEPLIGIVLDLKWRSGRLVRDYLMLLPTSDNARTSESAEAQDKVNPASSSHAGSVTPPVKPVATEPLADQRKTLETQVGDTAGALAKKIKPTSASVEQALLALVQENPAAFVEGNPNRMRAGVILDIPEASKILATSPAEAHQWQVEQSEAFDAYRSALAKSAFKLPAKNGLQLELQAPGRSASGSIQAPPPEAKLAEAPNDKLTLSQAEKSAQEALLAQAKQAKAQAERLAELKKTLGELNELQASKQAPAVSNAKEPASEPVLSIDAPGVKPTESESRPWLKAAGAALMVPLSAFLLALLLGYAGWWAYRRRHARQEWGDEPNADEGRAQKEGAPLPLHDMDWDADKPLQMAQQWIDAGQLDQAEAFLKTTLRNNPTLLTAQAKLLEIYALRTHGSGLQGLSGWGGDADVNVEKVESDGDFDFSDDDFELDTGLHASAPSGPHEGLALPLQKMPDISLDLKD